MIRRKWEVSVNEERYERLLKEEGFEIVDLKEYRTRTKYVIRKNGLEMPVEIPLISKMNFEYWVGFTVRMFNMYEQIEKGE